VFKKILVPLDGTPDAERALDAVKAVDSQFESDVTLLLVSPSEGALMTTLAEGFGASGSVAAAMERDRTMHDLGEAYLDSIRESYGDASWTSEVRPGNPGPTIVDVANELEVDLVIMASHVRSGISRILMGSVAEEVMRHADIPVMVIPVGHDAEDE
jgi:nucleotide-binding universal stress UspA family protein